MRKVLLISNRVFHYRVSNYNYFTRRFKEEGWEFIVRANELQKQNPYPLEFDFQEMSYKFFAHKQEIERLKPDVVILFVYLKDLTTWPLIHWLKLKRIPFVYWNKGINLEVKKPGWRNYLFYYVHHLSDAILLYSKHEIQHIQPKNRQKVFVANNTINFATFPQIGQSKEEIKREFKIPYEKTVLFVGRMRSVKKVEHLIQAFNSIEDPGIGCVIVGDAMDYNLPKLMQRDNIRYLGEIYDPKNVQVSKLFKMSDLFCIPGDVGLGLNEAFYWGLPVVTEAGLQPPEIHYLTPDRNGFIVAENNVDQLREKILLLLRDDSLRAKFSADAREHILREASIENMFSGFKECVEYVMKKKAVPNS
jgi:glycosyltransferase involved in cell wall biosynthesis